MSFHIWKCGVVITVVEQIPDDDTTLTVWTIFVCALSLILTLFALVINVNYIQCNSVAAKHFKAYMLSI